MKPGRLLPWLGIGVFVFVFGAWLQRELPAAGKSETLPSGEVFAEVEPGGEDWMLIEYQGARIGYTHTRRTALEDGVRTEEDVYLRMTLMGQARDVTTRQTLLSDKDGTLRSFTFRMESMGADIAIEGRQTEGKLHVTVDSAGNRQDLDFKLDEPVLLSGNLYRAIARAGLEPGKSYTRPFFDPSIMQPSQMTVKVLGKEEWKIGARTFDVYRLAQTYNGLEATAWVDADGTLYKEESETGFRSMRTTEAEAKRKDKGAPIDLIAATSVQLDKPLKSPREISRLVVELQNVDLEGFDLDGEGQKLEDNRLTIDRTTLPKVDVDDLKAYLKGEPLMQVDHPDIAAAVKEATGGFKEAREATKRILRWVYGALDKQSTVSLPSALEVLRTRQGDCNEHAILYTAMTRNVGVPSRIASGLVALEDSFYYHAWTELYLDGRWLAVDPVFGQYPADATHIRFVTGGLERQAELMRIIGRLKIKVLESEHGKLAQ